jgi:uncharacterized protein YjiK
MLSMKRIYLFFKAVLPVFIIVFVLISFSCNSKAQKKMKSPEGYDLNDPRIINLTKKIDQISGIVYSEKDNTLFAIDDDKGDLYHIPLAEDPEIKKWKFGKNADYEDLVLIDTMFYILESNGKIISFPLRFPITDVKEHPIDLKGFNEFESLYFESAEKRLIMLCKECKKDGGDIISAYSFFVLADSFSKQPVLQLQRKDVEKKIAQKTGRIKASAATVNPLTGEVFIISSINKLLIITDKRYNVREVYDLKRSLFKQPEGICFAPDGTLFISNEAGKNNKADILIYKRLR